MKGKSYRRGIMHLRIRYHFGYGYRCIQAVGKGSPFKMTPFFALVTCKNCKKWIKHKRLSYE